jgi:hypothetical protein
MNQTMKVAHTTTLIASTLTTGRMADLYAAFTQSPASPRPLFMSSFTGPPSPSPRHSRRQLS